MMDHLDAQVRRQIAKTAMRAIVPHLCIVLCIYFLMIGSLHLLIIRLGSHLAPGAAAAIQALLASVIFGGAVILLTQKCVLPAVRLSEMWRRSYRSYQSNAEQTIQQQKTALDSVCRLATLGEMSGSIAHELNSLMTALTLNAGLLSRLAKSDSISTQSVRDLAASLTKTTHHMGKILHGLRMLSKNDAAIPMESVPLSKVIDSALALYRDLSPKRFQGTVELQRNIAESEIRVCCHPIQMTQVLINLLNNAYDAVKDNMSASWVRLETQRAGGEVVIRVLDSGAGVPAEVETRLFQPLFTTKGPKHGTGLGLVTSRRIVEAHGGRLQYSKAGAHTCFSVYLPIDEHGAKVASGPSVFDDWIASHRQWRVRLREEIEAGHFNEVTPGEIEKENVCALGRWMESAQHQYGEERDFYLLQRIHAEFHQASADIVRLAMSGYHEEALEQLEAQSHFAILSEEIIEAIEKLKGRH